MNFSKHILQFERNQNVLILNLTSNNKDLIKGLQAIRLISITTHKWKKMKCFRTFDILYRSKKKLVLSMNFLRASSNCSYLLRIFFFFKWYNNIVRRLGYLNLLLLFNILLRILFLSILMKLIKNQKTTTI